MKAIQGGPLGYGDSWLIDLEFSPWEIKPTLLRSEGVNGTTLRFKTRDDALAKIAALEKSGEQARILKYSEPTGPPQVQHIPVEPAPSFDVGGETVRVEGGITSKRQGVRKTRE